MKKIFRKYENNEDFLEEENEDWKKDDLFLRNKISQAKDDLMYIEITSLDDFEVNLIYLLK